MFCNTVISRPVISANETNRGGFLLCSGAAAQQRSSAAAQPRPPDNLSASLEIHQINILHGWRGRTGGRWSRQEIGAISGVMCQLGAC